MKIRDSFVSNSSSTSFIITGPKVILDTLGLFGVQTVRAADTNAVVDGLSREIGIIENTIAHVARLQREATGALRKLHTDELFALTIGREVSASTPMAVMEPHSDIHSVIRSRYQTAIKNLVERLASRKEFLNTVKGLPPTYILYVEVGWGLSNAPINHITNLAKDGTITIIKETNN
jgi:hypothetical protein